MANISWKFLQSDSFSCIVQALNPECHMYTGYRIYALEAAALHYTVQCRLVSLTENVLSAASYAGYEKIVKLPLRTSATVNAQSVGGKALDAPSENGHEQVVRLARRRC